MTVQKQNQPEVEQKQIQAKQQPVEPKPKKKQKQKNIWLKDIVLAVVNVAMVAGLVFLLNKLPARANQVKSLRSNAQLINTAEDDTDILQFELDQTQEDYGRLMSLYPDEERLLTFVDEIEKLQETGSVIGFTFASRDPVVDKTKELGLPIIIEMRGTWEQISADIQAIQQLSFMFRPVTFDAEENREENVVQLKYGGFLYVDESFEKN